jgi:acyl-CoA reductase-like NAD-dependent aldehyde dehydrogenase
LSDRLLDENAALAEPLEKTMSQKMPASATMTIGGKAVAGAATLDVVNPATEEVIAAAPDAGEDQLDAAVSAARAAFASWAATPLAQRQQAIAAVGGVLLQQIDELSALLTREQGKPLAAARAELQISAYWCAEFAKMKIEPEVLLDDHKSKVIVRHVPIGVVGGIVPWNFPVILAAWKIAPALLAGNTMVLKPSPFTPLTTLRLGELLRGVLPPGVLNVISGGDRLGPWMSAHSGIDKISFTGSTPTGRKVMESGARNLKRLTLELGGNDAAIVLSDVDVKTIAPKLFWGAFQNSSQYCLAIKRLYLHESIYDEVAQAFVQLAAKTKVGRGDQEGTQLGPIQNRQQYERLKALLEDCRRNGYRFLAGGELPAGKGYFFPVTLVDNPPDNSRIVREEPFGPILPLLKYRTVDEAVARANDSEYGLGGSVWAGNVDEGLAIAERLQTGTVWVNEIHHQAPDRPMAGHKQSGIGVENGLAGLLEYTIPQTLSIRKTATASR